MRVTIVGALRSRGGRPSFKAMAGDIEGLIELDNSAAAKLGGHQLINDAKLADLNGARDAIEDAATRLFDPVRTTPLAADGRWHLLLSALDLD